MNWKSYDAEHYIAKTAMMTAVDVMKYGNHNPVIALLLYYVLCNTANYNAIEWRHGNYARMLYPKANLDSQRICALLSAIGEENPYRAFSRKYSEILKLRERASDIYKSSKSRFTLNP